MKRQIDLYNTHPSFPYAIPPFITILNMKQKQQIVEDLIFVH
jgi:hypothetical protein